MRDVWQILFSRWRNVQWRMITQFSKRSIDLFVLRILKEKWFFLIQCARRKLFSYNWTGYSIITGFANDLYALSMPKNYRRNRLWFARTKVSCPAIMFAMYLLHAGGLLEYCRGKKNSCNKCLPQTCLWNFHGNRLYGKRAIHCNTGAMFDHVLKRR